MLQREKENSEAAERKETCEAIRREIFFDMRLNELRFSPINLFNPHCGDLSDPTSVGSAGAFSPFPPSR